MKSTENEQAALEVCLRALKLARRLGHQVTLTLDPHLCGPGIDVAILPNLECETWRAEGGKAKRTSPPVTHGAPLSLSNRKRRKPK